MKWEDQRSSSNVEDRRDAPAAGGGGFSLGGGRLGIGTVLVVLAVGWFMGINPLSLLGLLEGGGRTARTAPV